jgi:TolB-like protein/Flp pilus assembly protein TadD
LLYSFETFLFDTGTRELRRDQELLSVEPRVFDLLSYLITNRERVVSKDDLIADVWKGRIVSDAALTTCLNAARTAIGDSGEDQRLIKTLPRKGFRFVGAVAKGDRPNASEMAPDDQDEGSKPLLVLPEKPSIAVLPFENISGDPEQQYFADGIVEEIITALSRFKSLFVIARNSSFAFKGRAVNITEVGRKLGVRYVLEGAVRNASGKVRITGQLIDAVTGAHIWADRFERELTDIFALQDEVTAAIVSAIQPRLLQMELAIAARRRPENLTAYDCYLRAMQQYYLATREGWAEAIRLARRALELDPRFGVAAALAAHCHTNNVMWGFASNPQFDRKEAVRLLHLALSVDDGDPETLARASIISCGVVGDPEREIEMAKQAVTLNPNSFLAWSASGWAHLFAGLPEEAVRSYERAIRMNPLDPRLHLTLDGMGTALIELGRYDEAIIAGKKARLQNPSHLGAYFCLASALAHLGRDAEAHEATARLLEIDPAFTVSGLIARLSNPLKPKLYFEGLRKAGLPR